MNRRVRVILRLLALAFLMLVFLVGPNTGCRSRIPYRLVRLDTVYTLTNLHPDERRGTLYSANYQGNGLIPVCTPVQILVVSKKKMIFRRLDVGRRYQYIFHHSSLRDPIPVHLDKYFGEGCPDQELQSLSPTDLAGVQGGTVYQGMSKRGVVLALGYPPEHGTPNLQDDMWKYWRTRFNTFEVYFDRGHVVGIRQ